MHFAFQPSGKQKIDPDAYDKLLVKRSDFLYALENDVKPVNFFKIISVSSVNWIGSEGAKKRIDSVQVNLDPFHVDVRYSRGGVGLLRTPRSHDMG